MTTVREPAPTQATRSATPVEVPPSCRVSILAGDSHQIDLVLPSAAPLTTLLDPTVIAINKVLRGRGAAELPPAAYEFARAAGMTALASDVSLAGHNIADGDVLALVPAGAAERYGPVVENVSTALAQYASDHFVRVTAQTALAVAVVIIGGALGVASMLLLAVALGSRERAAGADPVRGRHDRPARYRRDRCASRRGTLRHRRCRVGCARHSRTGGRDRSARRVARCAARISRRGHRAGRDLADRAVHRSLLDGGRGDHDGGLRRCRDCPCADVLGRTWTADRRRRLDRGSRRGLRCTDDRTADSERSPPDLRFDHRP